MEHPIRKCVTWLCCAFLTSGLFTSCDMMKEDLDDCPTGLYLSFRYDYNLDRADMFGDHVGAVSVYVFDESGNYVSCQEASNAGDYRPLSDPLYKMHLDLAPGRYQFIALAGQRSYDEMFKSGRARFIRTLPQPGEAMDKLEVRLETVSQAVQDGINSVVDCKGLPLDTLWHGMECTPIEVSDRRPTYHTISLVRDTKKINVTLRELDDPSGMDVADYEMRIFDRNTLIRWDNSIDESAGGVAYLPQTVWNTEDKTSVSDRLSDGDVVEGVGKIAHADFMTSRIIYHEDPAEDAILSVTDKRTGLEVIRVNLPDLLSRLSTSEELYFYRYTPQEFLDRGYNYQLSFFLRGGKLQNAYIGVSIGMLSWCQRQVQFVDLQ